MLVALFSSMYFHVVEACMIGMIISAGWHATYAYESVLAFVEHPMLPGTHVSLFFVSLASLGTVPTLANFWVLPLSCLDYHNFFFLLCWSQAPGLQHQIIVLLTGVLLFFCWHKPFELQLPTNVGGLQPLPPSVGGHMTLLALGFTGVVSGRRIELCRFGSRVCVLYFAAPVSVLDAAQQNPAELGYSCWC